MRPTMNPAVRRFVLLLALVAGGVTVMHVVYRLPDEQERDTGGHERTGGNVRFDAAGAAPHDGKSLAVDALPSGVQPINASAKHDRWIVITSVAPPTSDVIFLSRLPGWKVVVVGDTKTPSDWSYPNCVYLSVSTQEKLGLRIASKLPYKSYTRKNIGYLYAIAHGAKIIYETDDDNRPLDGLKSFYMDATCSGLMYAGRPGLFNPYKHFGQATLWPRGYPLGGVGQELESFYRLCNNWTTPLIQQGVVNGDPDMDAIFRLTRKKTLKPLEVTFDPTAPPAILPEGVFSPFNSQNTIFHYNAFALLMLPTTTPFRMCDIWRGYWAQRLLWEIGGHLGFFPPNAYQARNAHSYMADAEDEETMYYDTDRLLAFLAGWSCPAQQRFFDCVLMLTTDMAREKFWKEDDVAVTQLWLQDLTSVGYAEPQRVAIATKTSANVTGSSEQVSAVVSEAWASTTARGSFVNFAPVEQIPPSVVSDPSKDRQYNPYIFQMAELCSNVTNMNVSIKTINKNAEVSADFSDTLLVVVFNFIEWLPSNIQYLNIMHRNHFQNVVYCGANCSGDCFRNISRQLPSDVSFIEAPIDEGWYGYMCLTRAVRMSYNVSGYLVIGDDTLINPWNLRKLDKRNVWHSRTYLTFNNCTKGDGWIWWGGEREFVAAMVREMQTRARQADHPHHKQAIDFYRQMERNTGFNGTCSHGLADTYYIPRRFVERMVHMLELFEHVGKDPIFMEIAVPTTIYGTVEKKDVTLFNGTDVWFNDRQRMWEFYKPRKDQYMHPIKLSSLKKPVKEKFMMLPSLQIFCEKHLMNLIKL